MKASPAYEKWTVEYFRTVPKLNETVIIAEPKKETMVTNEGQMFTMKFQEFLSKFKIESENVYLVDAVPIPLQ